MLFIETFQMNGFLHKRARGEGMLPFSGAWAHRWFELDEGTKDLKYYAEDNNGYEFYNFLSKNSKSY